MFRILSSAKLRWTRFNLLLSLSYRITLSLKYSGYYNEITQKIDHNCGLLNLHWPRQRQQKVCQKLQTSCRYRGRSRSQFSSQQSTAAAASAPKQMLSIHHLPLCCCHKFIHLFSGHDFIILIIMIVVRHQHHAASAAAAAGQTIILRWSPIRLSKLHLHCNGRPINMRLLGPFIKSNNN